MSQRMIIPCSWICNLSMMCTCSLNGISREFLMWEWVPPHWPIAIMVRVCVFDPLLVKACMRVE
jgi:hypothetical protein